MSKVIRSRRQDLVSTILFAIVSPGFFIVLASLHQFHLSEARRKAWLVVVLAIVVGGLTVALPRKFPLIASILAIVAFEYVSTFTEFNGITMFCCVLAGFFFGVYVRSLLHQRKHWNDSRSKKVLT